MKKIFSILILLLVSAISFSQDNFNTDNLLRNKPSQLVNDYTGTLTADQRQALENKLVAFDDSTSTQIAVVIIPTLNGKDVADFNIELGRTWGVGGKEFNNGIVLLIAKNDRKLNIATGYGLEGALPDLTAKQIIDEIIVPSFKGDDYYRGIEEGTDAIIQAVKGEYKAPKNYGKRSRGIGNIIFIIILIVIFLAISGGRGGGGSFMSRRGFAAWTIANMLGGSGRGGGWSGGGGGGSSGGGFGGFGGGSFGGGGASGSW
ncbi:MAG TPA: TPM domain-containing protein [Ferruginibacter sp.]|nr:TPM domain-containing protein [Ferruginibacter sp.]